MSRKKTFLGLFGLLTIIGLFYYFPFSRLTWFYHDDFDFLLGSFSFNLKYLLSPHNEHFLPVFRILFWLEFLLFKFNFKFYLLVSILLHLSVLWLLFLIVKKITKKNFWGFLAVFFFGFNGNFYEVILWATGQQILLCCFFMALSFLFWLKYRQKKQPLIILGIFASTLLSAASFGVGALNGFSLLLTSLIDKKSDKKLKITLMIQFLLMTILFLNFKLATGLNLAKMLYFAWVGIFQGTLSRFFYAPFAPSRTTGADLWLMPVLNIFIIIFLWLLFKIKTKKDKVIFYSLALFSLYPYLLTSISRFSGGAKGAMAERYIYIPLFFIIILIIYQLSFLKPTKLLKKIIFIFLIYFLITQCLVFYYRSWQWLQRPIQAKKFFSNLQTVYLSGKNLCNCQLPEEIKPGKQSCLFYQKLLLSIKIPN